MSRLLSIFYYKNKQSQFQPYKGNIAMDINIVGVKSQAEQAQLSSLPSPPDPNQMNHNETLLPTSSCRKVRDRKKQDAQNRSEPIPKLQEQTHLPDNQQHTKVCQRKVFETPPVITHQHQTCETFSSKSDKISEQKKITSEDHELLCRHGELNKNMTKEDTETYPLVEDRVKPEIDQKIKKKDLALAAKIKGYFPQVKANRKMKNVFAAMQEAVEFGQNTPDYYLPNKSALQNISSLKKELKFVEKKIEKQSILQTLGELKKKYNPHSCKELKRIAFILAGRLKKNYVLSEWDKEDIKTWFLVLVKYYHETAKALKEKSFDLSEILADSILIFQQILNKDNLLISPDLIPLVTLPTLLKDLYDIASHPSAQKKQKLALCSLISPLCICFIQSPFASMKNLHKETIKTLKVHLNSLQEISIPSKASLKIIATLYREESNPQYLLTLIKMIVNFYDISDFNDMNFIRGIIEQLQDVEVTKALNAFLIDGDLPHDLKESKNPNILWIRATIAANQMNFELAERLLMLATEQEYHMGLELALFCLNQWPHPNNEQIKIIRDALVQSETTITEFDQYLWQQCMTRFTYLSLLNEPAGQGVREKKSTEPEPKHPEREIPPERLVSNEAVNPVSVVPAVDSYPSVNLTSVNNMAKGFIKKYRIIQPTSGHCSEITQFQVVGWNNKIHTIYEAMKPANRNPKIIRILNYIHHCRSFNNLEQEILAYQILAREDLRYLLHFDRLLEEMVWTLLHCVDDPQKGGFEATQEERLHALNLALELILVCIEYTIKPHGIITKGRSLSDVFDEIYLWLDNIDHFNNDPELQQYLRQTLRCRAGSTLGHIYRFKADLTKRAEMEKKAFFCFQAKTRFDPNYRKNNSKATIAAPIWFQFGNGEY